VVGIQAMQHPAGERTGAIRVVISACGFQGGIII
jgi:hypothetical protein